MKLTDKEFWSILREGAGIYGRTVRLIKKEYGIDINRVSVRERALKDPDQLKDIREENIDVAEEGLHSLMRSKNEAIRLKAVQLYLKTIGKKRGYVERQEFDIDLEADMNFTVEFIMPE
jgi:hypothetical protein